MYVKEIKFRIIIPNFPEIKKGTLTRQVVET